MTFPQTRFVLLVLLLLQIVATMQVFTEPYVMTGGGPDDSTVTVLLLLYRYAFVYNDFGSASAHEPAAVHRARRCSRRGTSG